MSYKIKKGGKINDRYRIVVINNRYFIIDYVNPYKLINYVALYSSAIRSSYPAWEIEEEDLDKLKYKKSEKYLERPRLFKGAYDPMYEEGIIDAPQEQAEAKTQINYGYILGVALTPIIAAIPGLNLPMSARWVFLFIALGFAIGYLIKLLRIPELETDHYKPILIGRDGVYGRKMTGLRLFGRTIGFLFCISIQIFSIYGWGIIPLRNFNIILYFGTALIAWFCVFGYFDLDPRETVSSDSDPDKEEMKKYIIVEDMGQSQKKDNRLSFITYVIVWLLVSAIVYIFRLDFVYESVWALIAIVSALVAVSVASRSHDGY